MRFRRGRRHAAPPGRPWRRLRRGGDHPFRPGEIGVIPLALGLIFFPGGRIEDPPPPIHVQVDGSVRAMPPGATLRELLDDHDLDPERGDLLDVEGQVLVADAVPGEVLVNGRPARPVRLLSDGDRVSVIDAEDETESTERDVVDVPEGEPGNPQFFLGSTPGEQIVVSGARSGKVASVTFRPTGPAKRPRQVALTFDDGPHERWTPKILRVLRRFDVPATFFVVGYLAERYPKIVKRANRLGMSVASHSMHHPYRPAFHRQPRTAVAAEIRQPTTVLERMGIEVSAFRPPGGAWSPRVLNEASSHGQRLVLWSVDSRDWAGLSANQIAAQVLGDVEPGSIVLLHDGGGDRSATLAALPKIIKGLRKMNLRPVAI